MPRKVTPTAGEALNVYLDVRATYTAANTLMNDRAVLRSFVKHIGQDKRTWSLGAADVTDYFVSGKARALNGSSFNKERSRVANLLTFWHRRGWVDRADLLGDIRPRPVVRRERLRLSPVELLALVADAPDPRDRAMLAVAVNSGLRAGEIASLRIRDVDLVGGWLHVNVTKSHLEDQVPVTADMDGELRLWLTTYAADMQHDWQSALPADALLFPARWAPRGRTVDGEVVLGSLRPYSKQAHPHRVVQAALLRAGVDISPGEGFHTIRRSVGRCVFEHASAQGHDAALRIAAATLHHASVTTTELYLGLRHDQAKRDTLLRGQEFLGAMSGASVTPLRVAKPNSRT